MSSRPAVRRLGRISEISQVAAKHGFGYFFDTHGPGAFLSSRQHEIAPEPDEGSTRADHGRMSVSLWRSKK